jgi:beta-xylosidase
MLLRQRSFDDDGTMYVVFLTGWNTYSVYIAQLMSDGLGEVGYAEGFKLYKREGYYYILALRPQTRNIILRSENLWGPYEWKWLVNDAGMLLPGFMDPNQGGLLELDDGRWYHLTFIDGYPGGRIPAVAPVDWSEDGWRTVRLIDGKWSANE